MNHARLTDDAEMAADLKAKADAVLALLPLIATDPVEQAAALIAAASAVIEREVGAAMAPPALMALIEPMLTEWQGDRAAAGHA